MLEKLGIPSSCQSLEDIKKLNSGIRIATEYVGE